MRHYKSWVQFRENRLDENPFQRASHAAGKWWRGPTGGKNTPVHPADMGTQPNNPHFSQLKPAIDKFANAVYMRATKSFVVEPQGRDFVYIDNSFFDKRTDLEQAIVNFAGSKLYGANHGTGELDASAVRLLMHWMDTVYKVNIAGSDGDSYTGPKPNTTLRQALGLEDLVHFSSWWDKATGYFNTEAPSQMGKDYHTSNFGYKNKVAQAQQQAPAATAITSPLMDPRKLNGLHGLLRAVIDGRTLNPGEMRQLQGWADIVKNFGRPSATP